MSKFDTALAMLREAVTNPDTPADRVNAQRALDATFKSYGCHPGDVHDFGDGHKLMLVRDPVRGNLAWVAPASPMAQAFRQLPAGSASDDFAQAKRISENVTAGLAKVFGSGPKA